MQLLVPYALEFDRIREALAREAVTPLGRARALALEPAVEVDEVRTRLGLAEEAAAFARTRHLDIDAPENLRETLGILEVGERERHIGPALSMLHDSTMPPWRLTRPKVGRSALMPQVLEGDVMEPWVSVPIEKPTSPAAVAEPGPADEPPEPLDGFQGFLVLPRNQFEP
jgi:hypothetical protein